MKTRIKIIEKNNGAKEYIPQYTVAANSSRAHLVMAFLGTVSILGIVIIDIAFDIYHPKGIPLFVVVVAFFLPAILILIGSIIFNLEFIYSETTTFKSEATLDEAKAIIDNYLLNIEIDRIAMEATEAEKKRNKIKSTNYINHP